MRLVFLPLNISGVCSSELWNPQGVKYHSGGDVSRYSLASMPSLFPLTHDEFLWGQNDLLFMLDWA